MFDPRIYRTGLIAVALAVIVVAFSLGNQQGPEPSPVPPEAFNGANAYANMTGLAAKYPSRPPGSTADHRLATQVATALRADGFSVSDSFAQGNTVDGARTLETVTGVRTGLSTSGSIVILTHRDSLGSPSVAGLSGTGVLLELARLLSGETHHRSVVLVSTSGSAGLAGATQVARRLSGPVDAVIALGNLAGSRATQPVIVPWSGSQDVAPTLLRSTLATALAAQANLHPGGTSIAGELAHLAFPLTTLEQGPFGSLGEPAVSLSLSGERSPAANEPISGPGRITNLGRTVLETINALDAGPEIPAASSYMLWDGKVVPAWAVRLLVIAFLLPVLLVAVDGLARARRRGFAVARWILWVLGAALPFVLSLLIILGAQAAGVLHAPPGPTEGGRVPLHGSGTVVLVVVALAIVLSFVAWRPLVRAIARGQRLGTPANPGAAAAVVLVMCVVTLVIWAGDPFAALLFVPATHLWMWMLDPDRAIPRPVKLVMLLAGVAPIALIVLYDAHALGLGPLGVAWESVLLIASRHVGIAVALEWSVVLGCLASVISIFVRTPRIHRHQEEAPVTVRGPVTYAGPGSLGGTESALRR
jgi:hypothetical protein